MSKFLLALVMGMGILVCEARAEADHPAVTIESLLGEMIDRDAIGVEFKKLPTEDWSAVIPADKNLDPAWMQSLTQRGKPREYTGDALMKIGMPAGGICAGLVYLGGDGKLWWWDIFNRKLNGVQPRQIQYKGRSWHGLPPGLGAWQGGNYIEPVITQPSPFQQGFALRLTVGGKTRFRNLDRTGWKSVTFSGSYPVGTVTYADPDCPVRVKLEAYSPFIPLDFDNSSYPATIMSYQLENTGSEAVKAEVVGWLENAVLIDSGKSLQGIVRTNQITTQQGSTMLACAASRPPAVEAGRTHRPDIMFDDFEKDTYEGWTVEGSAFGKGPVAKKDVPIYQGDLGMHGSRAVNSHASALVNVSGSDQAMSTARDDAKGTLTSKSFKVERDYISFLIDGGNKPECALRLVADGKVLKSASGHDANKLSPDLFDVREFTGRTVHLEIIDQAAGAWANIGVDDIVFTDKTAGNSTGNSAEITTLPDWGTLALATMGSNKSSGSARLVDLKDPVVVGGTLDSSSPMDKPLIGGVTQSLTLAPGASGTAKFVIAWHFANQPVKGVKGSETGWYYGKRFKDAAAVATHIAAHEPELSAATLRWRDTWLDSTLPYWFLDRSFISLDCLASTTCYRFADGRFYTYEGVRSCEGHPNHVWHYAQGHARLFPELEQDVLERVWYGFGFHADGSLAYRGEVAGDSAIDGHCGVILSVLRNFQTSTDGAALKRIWPQVKKSIEYAMACDRDGNGLLDTPKLTTLDEPWHGEIPWISSLYIAALKAGEVMATEMGDAAFAADCRDRAAKGRAAMDARLFNGEWFIQKPDPANLTKLGAYETVHIDQVLGQAWAWQVGLGRVLNEATTRSALRSIWKYNFARNLDSYDAKADPKGRPYYSAGEGGLVMTANALGRKTPFGVYSGFACYLNETMNGFEYQAAAHMIAEGMVQEGLAVMKTLDERYDGNKRNPFDEVECGDHYARSMASYGALIAISGFTYDGPHGAIGFFPRLTPENFKAPFTAAEGWGSYSQKSEVGGQRSEIRVKWGSLRLRTISLATPAKPGSATVKVGDKTTTSSLSWQDGKATITLTNEVVITAGQSLEINLTKSTNNKGKAE